MTGSPIDTVIAALLEDEDGWIGVDLDGTLAKHLPGKYRPTKIGDPIPKMVARIRRWVGHGKKVKIFTARADDEIAVNAIKKWLKDNELPDLEVTNLKDKGMSEFWDDRAVGVKKNTGEVKENAEEIEQAIFNAMGQHVAGIKQDGDKSGHYVFIPAEFEGDEAMAVGPFVNQEAAQTFLDSEVGAPNATVVEYVPRRAQLESQADRIVKFLLDESLIAESPEIKTLKKNQVKLEPEEREQAMKAGAVWHPGNHEDPTCAIKKAVVKGKTWYWCNTHRAGQVRPTLKGAIRAFDFVKTTA